MDKIVNKVNKNKKARMQSNQNNQISVKDYCIEGGKTPKVVKKGIVPREVLQKTYYW